MRPFSVFLKTNCLTWKLTRKLASYYKTVDYGLVVPLPLWRKLWCPLFLNNLVSDSWNYTTILLASKLFQPLCRYFYFLSLSFDLDIVWSFIVVWNTKKSKSCRRKFKLVFAISKVFSDIIINNYFNILLNFPGKVVRIYCLWWWKLLQNFSKSNFLDLELFDHSIIWLCRCNLNV